MDTNKKYEEIGANYRYFLGWRHASVAGYLVILYGIVSLTIITYKEYPSLAYFIPLVSCPIGIIFWLVDKRTCNIYHAAIRAGKSIEGDNGGFYSELSENIVNKATKSSYTITHAKAFKILFIGYSVVLFLFSIILIFFQFCR